MPKPKKKEFSSLKVKQKKRPSLMKQLSQPFYSAKKKNKFVNGVHPLPDSSASMQNEKELILVVDDNLFVPLRREIDEDKMFALTQEDTVEPPIGPNLLKLKIEPHEMYSSVDSGYASPPVQGDFHTIPKGILKKMYSTLTSQVSDASSISPSWTSIEKTGEVSSLPFNANYWAANISAGTKNGSSGLQNGRPMSPSGQSMSPMARAISQNSRPLSPNETPSSSHERPMSPYGTAAIEDAFDLLDSIIEENGQNCLNTGATLAAKRKVVKKSVSFGHVTEIQKVCNDFDDTFADLAVVRKSVSFDRLDELKEESEYSKEIEENQNDLSRSNRRSASFDNLISHECRRDNLISHECRRDSLISHECHGDISDLKDIGHLTCEVELKMIEITPLTSDPAAMEDDLSISRVLQSFQIMVTQSSIAKHLSSPNLLQSEETGRSDQDNTEKDEGVDTGDHPDGATRIKKTPKPEGDKYVMTYD
ncbi:hypothetical protein ACJMK2_008686 [Sinanodonta woodiana]|uniref:Uncharacterized protein n=1 Tax=Sinanodonta woodiana TaxID=1069815 RepID=A0ABD3VPY3_SINWO